VRNTGRTAGQGPEYDPAVAVTLEPVRPEEVLALRNLWELYVHDFSEFLRKQPGADGRFESDARFARRIAPPKPAHHAPAPEPAK